MIKFSRPHTHDLYERRPKGRKLRSAVSNSEELEPLKNISLENLQALVSPEAQLGSPKNISLESLIAYSSGQSEELPPIQDISLADLKSFVAEARAKAESQSQSISESDEDIVSNSDISETVKVKKSKPTAGNVPTKAKHLEGTVAVAIAIAALAGINPLSRTSSEEESEESTTVTPPIRNRRRSERPIQKTTSLPFLYSKLEQSSRLWHSVDAESEVVEAKQEIRNRRRSERPASAMTKSPKLSDSSEEENPPSPTTKSKAVRPEPRGKSQKIMLKKHEVLLEKLKDLSEGQNLEIWLNSLNIPKEVNVPEMREKIAEFFKQKCWESGENSRWLLDGSFTKRLWSDFKELSLAKQIIIVIVLSVLIALIGFITLQLLSLLWPGVLGLATSGEGILVEIGVEAFKQRQEGAFHLLMDHAENAKPLTTAWANQYVLWKYMKRV